MELAYYQEFIELSKQLNFRKTAESLCLSQSALSKHLKALEDHYGCTLLARSRHSWSTPRSFGAITSNRRKPWTGCVKPDR